MNLGFLDRLPRLQVGFSFQPADFVQSDPKPETVNVDASRKNLWWNIKTWGQSLRSVLPWTSYSKVEGRLAPLNRELKQYSRNQGALEPGCPLPHFRPYVAKIPWHKGPRAFLSQLFPRYGHYCGPNWSSGKNNGSMVWDKRPVDWLDFCCYCHDIGYDTHDQAKLLKADLSFLECLEKQKTTPKGDAYIAHLYRTMCIAGLRSFLIPYRRQLMRVQAGEPLVDWLSVLGGKNRTLERSQSATS